MSSPHHTSDENNAARDRLLQQFLGQAERSYPQGRVGPHDEGEVAYGVAACHERKLVIVDFGGQPVTRLMLPMDSARRLTELVGGAVATLEKER